MKSIRKKFQPAASDGFAFAAHSKAGRPMTADMNGEKQTLVCFFVSI